MSGLPTPTYEELQAVIVKDCDIMAEQADRIAKLEAVMEATRELERSIRLHLRHAPRAFRAQLVPTLDVLRRTIQAASDS